MQGDIAEKTNLAKQSPEVLADLQNEFTVWLKSVKESFDGKEYGTQSVVRGKLKWKFSANGFPVDRNKKQKK
jgi:hypothetical protein